MTVFRVACLVSALASSAIAQTRPDFAGRWTTDADPAAAPAGGRAGGAPGAPGGRGGGGGGGGGRGRGPATMGSGWGGTITIAQDTARLTVQYTFFSANDMQAPIRYVFALDGSPTRNTIMMGRGLEERTSRAVWDGDKLAVTTSTTIPNPAGTGAPVTTEMKQLLSLESPTSLVIETTRAAFMGGAASTTRTVYRKL